MSASISQLPLISHNAVEATKRYVTVNRCELLVSDEQNSNTAKSTDREWGVGARSWVVLGSKNQSYSEWSETFWFWNFLNLNLFPNSMIMATVLNQASNQSYRGYAERVYSG